MLYGRVCVFFLFLFSREKSGGRVCGRVMKWGQMGSKDMKSGRTDLLVGASGVVGMHA